jgi:hypothetical protein
MIYSRSNSFPTGLGEKLVQGIPKDLAEFETWKAEKVKWLDELYQAETSKYTPVPVQAPRMVGFIPVANPTVPGEGTEIVYAEYFGGGSVLEQYCQLRSGRSRNTVTPYAWSEFPPENLQMRTYYLYVIDLDRDAFSVDSRWHFRLSKIPQNWRDALIPSDEGRPSILEPQYLASNILAPVPILDPRLLAEYKRCEITELDNPKPPPSQWLKTEIMLKLINGLSSMVQSVLENTWSEYTPFDIRMQKIIYALVKCCCWESLSFKPTTPLSLTNKEITVDMAPLGTALFHVSAFPRVPTYFIPVTNGNVLISLATHLDKQEVADVAIARVVEMVKEGEKQTACILSLQHVIIIVVDKTYSSAKVARTKLLEILHKGQGSEGAKSLVATLSNFLCPLSVAPFLNKNPSSHRHVVPLEIAEQIFKDLAILHPSSIFSFAAACKQFAALVSKHTLRFPGCTLFPFDRKHSEWLRPCVSGVIHGTLDAAIFYVAGQRDGALHMPIYDHVLVSFVSSGIFEHFGPRQVYEVLIDGTKSGLFGLAFCFCKLDEQSGGYDLTWSCDS